MSDQDAIWDAIRDLRERGESHAVRHAELDGRINQQADALEAMDRKLDKSMKERGDQYVAIMGKLNEIGGEISEYRGALQFGKWIAGILIALGVPAALIAAWGGHK